MAESLAGNKDFLLAAFRGYDKNKDGKISLAEFKSVMKKRQADSLNFHHSYLSAMSEKNVEAMFKQADSDGNG